MKEVFKKILKEVLGVDDATLEKMTVENVEDAVIEALIPTLSQQNRTKWEGVLSSDNKFTEQFSSRGHAAGLAKGLNTAKDLVLHQMGFKLDPQSDDYKDNDKFSAKLKSYYDEAVSKAAKTGEDVKTALAAAKAQFETEKTAALEEERKAVSTDYEGKMKAANESNALKMNLLQFASGKKIKGGLEIGDIMPAIEAKAKAFKFEFGEDFSPVKVYDSTGYEIDNEAKDGGKLKPSDIFGKIYEPFIDTTTDGGTGGGNGKIINEPIKNDTLKSTLLDLESFQN